LPQRIPADRLWLRPHVVTGAEPQTCLQQRNQVFDEKPKRETATRGDLAGGESHGAWATGQDGQPQGST
jgi:hypothetical protein